MFKFCLSVLCSMLVGACSATVGPDETPPHVQCHDLAGCPTDEALAGALEVFHDQASCLFDTQAPLRVVWYPNGTVFWRQGGAAVVGFAEDVDEIYVSNAGVLAHELMHVHLWRLFPDSYGDYDHEDGEGPWTETTNAVVSEISALFKADPTLQSGAGGR